MKLDSKNSLKNKKVLITCGPTWVPIDDMRIIGNRSSGSMGQSIAMHLADEGAKVTLLEGPVAKPITNKALQVIKFSFYDDFVKLIKKELTKKYDIIIHAAAVSDYKCKKTLKTKISSRLKSIKIELIPTKKVIPTIKKNCPNAYLVGFKLESKMNKNLAISKTRSLFKDSKCDLVIANSISNGKYSGFIVDDSKNVSAVKTTRNSITTALIKELESRI